MTCTCRSIACFEGPIPPPVAKQRGGLIGLTDNHLERLEMEHIKQSHYHNPKDHDSNKTTWPFAYDGFCIQHNEFTARPAKAPLPIRL